MQWAPGGDITWNGSDVKITLQEITYITTIAGKLDRDILGATITLFGGGGGATEPWEGKKLPDDVPF